MSLNESGAYLLVDHALERVLKGAAGILNLTGEWDPDVYLPEIE